MPRPRGELRKKSKTRSQVSDIWLVFVSLHGFGMCPDERGGSSARDFRVLWEAEEEMLTHFDL